MLHVFLSMALLPSAAWLETGFRHLLSGSASDHVALVSVCLFDLSDKSARAEVRWTAAMVAKTFNQ